MGIGLTSDELAQMRADIAALLPDTGYVLTISNTSDGQGGFTEGTVVSGTVSCRVDSVSSKEMLANAAITPFHRYIATLEYDATITETNRFQHSGNVYNVISVNDDQSWIGCKRVILEKR